MAKKSPASLIWTANPYHDWIKETGEFAYKVMQLKRTKSQRIAELIERGKELQIVLRKIKNAGGKAKKIKSRTMYVVKGSFEPDLFNPEIGNYTIEKVDFLKSINPELADELEKIHSLTYGYYGTVLAQLAGQFETLCKFFWKEEKEKEIIKT